MTERKPTGMSFTSWIDQQIAEAAERGAFDDLPGAGKPLPKRREDEDAGQAWIRDYAQREGVPPEDLLPEPLKLRRQLERLTETVAELSSQAQVREAVAELNQRIARWQRFPAGPPIFVPLADEDRLLARWRAAHREPEPGDPARDQQPDWSEPASGQAADRASRAEVARRRWRRVSSRPRRSRGSR